jgi:hypothetical protein
MTKIVAFAGRKQSGKSSSAEMIVDFYKSMEGGDPSDIKIYNFADPLKKDLCMNLLGLTYEQCYGSDDEKNQITELEWMGKKMTAREIMQFIGTEVFRKMKPNIWAEATISRIKEDKPKLAIIADCRFPNEVESVKNAGGCVIKLMLNPFNSNHESEVALDAKNFDHKNFDLVVFNNSLSLEQKNYAVLTFLRNKGLLQL